jgi:hypothetical protein
LDLEPPEGTRRTKYLTHAYKRKILKGFKGMISDELVSDEVVSDEVVSD